LHAHVRELGLSTHVRFVGWVDSARREQLFANADVVVLPSHAENFGMVVVEALAHARPVITTRGTPWQGVEHEGCGYWADTTPNALADAIRCLAAEDREE